MKISIIVPVYQAEKYIERCLNSLLEQDISDYEIICIDDGSTDNSAKLIHRLMESHAHLKYFYQVNQGVSVARNKGLQKARGEYIMFVDSDDWIRRNSLKLLYKNACKTNADILVFGGRTDQTLNTPEWIKEAFFTKKKVYEENSIQALFHEPGAKPSVCNKFFRRSIVGDNFFPENIHIAEDLTFLFMIFPRAKKICFIPQKIYIYRTSNLDSAMHRVENSPSKFFECHMEVVEYIITEWEYKHLILSYRQEIIRWVIDFLHSLYVELSREKQALYLKRLSAVCEILDCPLEIMISQLEQPLVVYEKLSLNKLVKSISYQMARYGFCNGIWSIVSKIYWRIIN